MAEALKIESLKLSERSSIEISTIKRNTKIETMNVICRWALTVSLSSDLPPPPLAKEDKILREIDWKIFAGDYEHLIMALLKSRMVQEKLSVDNETLNDQLRAHVQRGLSLIASQKHIRSIADFAELGLA